MYAPIPAPRRAILLASAALSLPVSFHAAHAAGFTVQEVTVTARRRVERAQDVPLPITVIANATLRTHGIDQLQQLQFLEPSFHVSLPNPRQTNLAIRGLGNNPATDGLSSSVGIYIDGVYLDRPGMGDFNLVDIDHIEVLRGPQGTLFGKNTTAGALNIVSKGPEFQFGGTAVFEFGNYGLNTERFNLTGPINNQWAYRITAYNTSHTGYLKNIGTGNDELSLNRQGARGQLLYKPDALISARLIGEFGQENDSQGALVLYNAGPSKSAKTSFVPFATWAHNEGITPLFGEDSFTTDINSPQQMEQHQASGSAEIDANVGPGTITSISAYRSWLFTPTNDFDWSNANAITDMGARDNEKQASQEIRFASKTGSPFDYVAGVYGFWRRLSVQSFEQYGPDYSEGLGKLGNPAVNNGYSLTTADPTSWSAAVFGQGTYHATPQLDFTVGLRETYEADGENVQRYPFSQKTPGTVPATLLPYSGSLFIRNYNYSALFTAAYKLAPNHMIYGTVSRGAKAGGFNSPAVPQSTTGAFLPTSDLIVLPEKVSDFEVGSKNTWFGGRLLINADLFWTVVENYQANTVVSSSTGFVAGIANVGLVRSRGAEGNATVYVTPDLSLTGSVAFDDARYLSFEYAPSVQGSVAPTQNLGGRPVLGASRFTYNLSADYRRMVTDTLQIYGNVAYAYKSGYYGYIDDSSYSWVKPYGLTDARVGLIYNEDYDVALWVKNAFNQKYAETVLPEATGSGGYVAAIGDPRTFGTTIRINF